MPREQLRALQLERMRDAVRHAYDNVAFYRNRRSRKRASTPDDLNGLEDLAKFPFVVKQDMRDAYPFGLFAVPAEGRGAHPRLQRHHRPGHGGGSHRRTTSTNWGDCFARGIAMVGGNERVHHPGVLRLRPVHGRPGRALPAAKPWAARVIPTSSGNTKRQVQMMKDCGTDILCLHALLRPAHRRHGHRDGHTTRRTEFKISGGIFGAEPWPPRTCARSIAEKLGIQYCDVYGLSEIMGPGVAMECAERDGLHVAEDHFYCRDRGPRDAASACPTGE